MRVKQHKTAMLHLAMGPPAWRRRRHSGARAAAGNGQPGKRPPHGGPALPSRLLVSRATPGVAFHACHAPNLWRGALLVLVRGADGAAGGRWPPKGPKQRLPPSAPPASPQSVEQSRRGTRGQAVPRPCGDARDSAHKPLRLPSPPLRLQPTSGRLKYPRKAPQSCGRAADRACRTRREPCGALRRCQPRSQAAQSCCSEAAACTPTPPSRGHQRPLQVALSKYAAPAWPPLPPWERLT